MQNYKARYLVLFLLLIAGGGFYAGLKHHELGGLLGARTVEAAIPPDEFVKMEEPILEESAVVEPVVKMGDSLPKLQHRDRNQMEMIAYIRDTNYRVFPELAVIISEGIIEAGNEYQIAPEILLALIDVESDFNYQVVSKSGAVGLTQVNPEVWLDPKRMDINLVAHGVIHKQQDLYDPKLNIRAGAFIFRHYLNQATKKGELNPLDYAATRYLGGKKNDHYADLSQAIVKISYQVAQK